MNKRLAANLAAFITVFLWASAFPLTKIIGEQITANPLSLIRCVVTAVFMILLGLIAKSPSLHLRKPFEKKDLWLFLISGATGLAFYYICYNMGLVTLTSAEASIISATAPVITSVMVYFIYKERINIIGWISIVAAFAGVAIMMLWNGVFSIKVGAFWILGMSVLFSIYCVLNRKLAEKGYNSVEIVAYSAIFATLLMSPVTPTTIRQLAACDMPAILSAIYLA
ncbi:MAG: DMT family transporter, partial [Eubacterium sp.]|nr:DMT family transporter [Candidatus Colimonas fimequi]